MDIEKLLKLLNDHDVCFVIIGATAFPVHGYSRATMDVDIFIEPSTENAENCIRALKEFGYDVSEVSVEDLLTKKVLFRQYLVEIDTHPFVKGVEFSTVWANRVLDRIGRTEVFFASLDDLIEMKKAVDRAKDIEDLKVLSALRARRSSD